MAQARGRKASERRADPRWPVHLSRAAGRGSGAPNHMAEEAVAASDKNKAESFEELLRRRIENWRYIKRAHEGSLHWMNIVALSREDITGFYTDPKLLQKRYGLRIWMFPADLMVPSAEEWFCMGISIAPLLQRDAGLPFISALQQFWDEFESYFGYGSVAEKGLVRTEALPSDELVSSLCRNF